MYVYHNQSIAAEKPIIKGVLVNSMPVNHNYQGKKKRPIKHIYQIDKAICEIIFVDVADNLTSDFSF